MGLRGGAQRFDEAFPSLRPMKVSIRGDLGLQLLALYLLFVGPVVIAAFVLDQIASHRLIADARATDLALAHAVAQETNTNLHHALQSIEQLAAYPAVIEADPAGMEDLFANLISARPDINLVYRLDADGIMLFHYPLNPGSTVGTDFSFREYYQTALAARRPFISHGRISPTTGQPVAAAVMPLRDDRGNFTGLVATNIKLQSLSETLASIAAEYPAEERLEIQIVDSSGRVIAHSDPTFPLAEWELDQPGVRAAVLSGASNNLVARDAAGEEVLYSYVPISRAGWGVVVSRPAAIAFATPRTFHRGVLLIITVFLSIGVFFWIALSRQVIRPLERLTALGRAIGSHRQLSTEQRQVLQRLSERPDQMGYLIRTLVRMEDSIRARLDELSTLLETSAAVVSSLDSRTVLERILEQVERLLGVEKCAIVALDEGRGVFRVQASRGLAGRYNEQVSIDPGEPQSVSMEAIRTGQPIQVSDTEADATFTSLRPRGRLEGFRSALAVPLPTQHAPPSVLLVFRPDPHLFSEQEIDLLTSFANHAAMAIENAALYTRSDARLNEQTRRLEALIQSMEDGLILEDLDGRVLYANRRIGELTALSLEEIIGSAVERPLERLLARGVYKNPEQKEKIRQAVHSALNGRGQRSLELATSDGRRIRYLHIRMFDVTDPQGMLLGRGQILRDVTSIREADRMKSSLIATVSHELRTPLASIKGYTTTLLAEDVQWDLNAQREFLEIISAETDRLSDLVNDLLDVSRIEAGNLKVSRELCQLDELIQRAAQRALPPPGDRLQVDLPAGLPRCYADPQRIEAVLRNLIENASKYAGESSPIYVRVSQQGNDLVFRVEDEGPGIPPEHSERIFEIFYRVENGLVRAAPGAGIGLAICQGFVRAHGGEIWLEPRPRGTCVAFSIPLEIRETPLEEENLFDEIETKHSG